jgi:hypothetical protein
MDRDDQRLALAHKISLQRSIRMTEFPHEMFDEHAWVMLLTAYQREAAGETYTAADIATMSGTTIENGTRWLKWLRQDGFVTLEDNVSVDGPLRLTALAIERMNRYLDAALQVFGSDNVAEDRASR